MNGWRWQVCENGIVTLGTSMSGLVDGLCRERPPPAGVRFARTGSGQRAFASLLREAGIGKVAVGLGFFGGIDNDVRVGDILVPTEAVTIPPQPYSAYPASAARAAALAEAARRIAPTHTGVVATAPAVLRGPSATASRLLDVGAVGVDMETANLFADLAAASIEHAALLVCSDHVLRDPLPEVGDSYPPLGASTRPVVKRALAATVHLLREWSRA